MGARYCRRWRRTVQRDKCSAGLPAGFAGDLQIFFDPSERPQIPAKIGRGPALQGGKTEGKNRDSTLKSDFSKRMMVY